MRTNYKTRGYKLELYSTIGNKLLFNLFVGTMVHNVEVLLDSVGGIDYIKLIRGDNTWYYVHLDKVYNVSGLHACLLDKVQEFSLKGEL